MWSWIKALFGSRHGKCWVIGCEEKPYRGGEYCATHKATADYIKSRPLRNDWWKDSR